MDYTRGGLHSRACYGLATNWKIDKPTFDILVKELEYLSLPLVDMRCQGCENWPNIKEEYSGVQK